TQSLHTFLNALLNSPGIGFPKLKTQEHIVIGRPGIRGKLETRTNPFVAHDATTLRTDPQKTRQSPLQPFFGFFRCGPQAGAVDYGFRRKLIYEAVLLRHPEQCRAQLAGARSRGSE